MKMYYENDADLSLVKNYKVAIYGYGSQGHAHAQNLRDSGVNVCVALRKNSQSKAQAMADGFVVKDFEEAANWANFHMLLLPDQVQKSVFENSIKPHLKPCEVLAFAHGFNIHFAQITVPNFVDVLMVAPKSPGHLVRRTFQQGEGTPCLFAIHQDYSGNVKNLALSYAKGIGGTRAGVLETSFKEETETDLFGEQAVLCGGVSKLVQYGFETLVEAGYAEELAYFECLHELKLIVDLFYQGGLTAMNHSVSETAEYGGYTQGERVISPQVKVEMKRVLEHVQNGGFADEYLRDAKAGQPKLKRLRAKENDHLIEAVGKRLRSQMTWLKADKKKAS